jgi:hypothetical protein
MPVYSNAYPPYSVAFGEQQTIVNAEQLGAGNFSSRVAIADKGMGVARPVLLTFTYATVPASVQYDIYAAWDDTGPTISYTKIGTTNNPAGDQVTINRAAAGGNDFRFICVKEVISPGVNATIKVQQ